MTNQAINVMRGGNGAAGKHDARTGATIKPGQPVLIYWPGQPHACYEVATQERLVALMRAPWPVAPGTSLPVLAIAD